MFNMKVYYYIKVYIILLCYKTIYNIILNILYILEMFIIYICYIYLIFVLFLWRTLIQAS